MPLGAEVGLCPGDIVLDRDPAAPNEMGAQLPPFSAHVYCSQTTMCIRIPLGTEVLLSLGDIVLNEDPAPVR